MKKKVIFNKAVGYFSFTDTGNVFCDGDACVIAGSKKAMLKYIKKMAPKNKERDIIKKTTFSEIIKGLEAGAAYAFDEESCRLFLPLAKQHGIADLPDRKEFFSEPSPTGLHFMQIQIC